MIFENLGYRRKYRASGKGFDMKEQWIFGWTQLLTIVGMTITIVIAIGGFRTFARWKREKIEESRIDVALEGLALAYESAIVFDEIRSPLRSDFEWEKMPNSNESAERRKARGSHWTVLKRIDDKKDFFNRLWELQPTFMAVFGPETEAIFSKLHGARNRIEYSSEALIDAVGIEHDPSDQEMRNFYRQLRVDTSCSRGEAGREGDAVGKMILEFRNGIEELARPIVDREFGKANRKGLRNRCLDWVKAYRSAPK